MKKIIFSFAAIATVAVVAGVASFATWSDTETSNGNKITADKLDLQLAPSVDGPWLDDNDFAANGWIPVEVENTFPGDSGDATVFVKNSSKTVAGKLTVQVSNVSQREVSLEEPEKDDSDDWSEHEGGNGELCDEIRVDVKYRGVLVIEDESLKDLDDVTISNNMVPGEVGELEMSYTVNSAAGNNIMTDKCSFDMSAVLTQISTI